MTAPWTRSTGPARAIAAAATAAVTAARRHDAAALRSAAGPLALLSPEQVGLTLGTVVRLLLEDLHPDGLTGDDVHSVLLGCARAAVGWFPEVDAGVLAALLTGALGVYEPDGDQPLRPDAVASHAPLLVAYLLDAAGRPLEPYLDAAFAAIARGEAAEAP